MAECECLRDLIWVMAKTKIIKLSFSLSHFLSLSENDFNEKWLNDVDQLRNAINKAINNAIESMTLEDPQICARLRAVQATPVEKEIRRALGKSLSLSSPPPQCWVSVSLPPRPWAQLNWRLFSIYSIFIDLMYSEIPNFDSKIIDVPCFGFGFGFGFYFEYIFMRKCLLELRTKGSRHIIISSAVRCVHKSTYDWWCFPEHFRRHFFFSFAEFCHCLSIWSWTATLAGHFRPLCENEVKCVWCMCSRHCCEHDTFFFLLQFDCDYIYKRLQSLLSFSCLFRRIAEKMYVVRMPRVVIERWQWQNRFGSYATWSIEEIKNIIANMSTGRTVCWNNVSINRLFFPRFHKNTINDGGFFWVFSHSIKCVVLCEEQTHLYA